MKHLYLLLVTIFFSLHIHAQQAPFITTWEVTAGSLNISIPTFGTGYNYTIDFGDGIVQNNMTGVASHTYSTPGVYTVTISGNFPRINFETVLNSIRFKLMSVEQWGDIEWQSMEMAFYKCQNLIINATDAPDLSQVTSMAHMFSDATSLNQSINHWDVSNVTNMQEMFRNASSFNQPLNSWNVSNVTNMQEMFRNASSFNQPLNSWNVSNVTNMEGMFFYVTSFNQPLNSWNVSNVTNMEHMFRIATSFDQPLNNWDVSNVTSLEGMFYGASSFNQPLNNWDVFNVSNMLGMFGGATSFNQPLNDWDVSNVSNMHTVFANAISFNQPLNNWNVSNVSNMDRMFTNATSFNQPLNDWDVSNVTNMFAMFQNATSFNQPLNNWDVSNVLNINGMFHSANLFNQPLDNWDVSDVLAMELVFYNATSFNQPLNNWNVSNITSMRWMFSEAYSFNQPLDSWDVSNVTNMGGMFYNSTSFNQKLSDWNFHSNVEFVANAGGVDYGFLANTGMDVENYDALLLKFAHLDLVNKTLYADGLNYCAAGVRDYLINQRGWTFNGDSLYANCNMITGTVLYDQNANGCDLNDPGADGIMITANDGINDWITFSSNGNYDLSVYGTNFTVSVINQPGYFTVTPASVPVTFTTSQTEIVDFCETANQSIEDLNVTLLPTSEARPGFEADYRLVVRNVGTETISNVLVILDFDDMMQQFVSANPAPGTTTANSLTFPIGSMQPFQKFEADITMQTFPPPTVNGDDILNFTAEVTPGGNDYTPIDNIYHLGQVVVNSFDPNDKQVLQGAEVHIDDVDQYLDYLIRFQNTGTASAINVRILDTLHPKLDWNTLTPISASHDYYVQITDGNQVEFMFDDIHLPDETTNEPESHGFVAYKIKPKSNVQVGDVISGDAAIYFDFNAPIITNMVLTEIVEPMGLTDNSNPLNQVILHPNPTNKTLHIYLTEGIQLEEVIIYDLQGQEVQKVQGNKTAVEVGNLGPGMYFLKITTNRGVVNRKLVKN